MVNRTQRPKRASINGVRNVLTVSGKEPGYEYRIVNDIGDRIAQFEESGYEIVNDSNIRVGDRRIANPTKEGTPVQVSVGGGQKGFLMRIPKEWYEENQKEGQALVDKTEAAMKQDVKSAADYGRFDIK